MSEDKANYNGPGKVKFVGGKRPEPSVTSALDVQTGGDHYKDMKIQPVEFIHANGLPFIEGAIIKYVCRHKAKNGRQDLEKARHFIDMLLELEYPEEEKQQEKKPHPSDDVGEGYRKIRVGESLQLGDEYFSMMGYWKVGKFTPGDILDDSVVPYRRPMKGQDNG